MFDELRAGGYRGSYAHLRQAVVGWRDRPARHGLSARVPTPPPPEMPRLRPLSPRQARWLLLRPAEDLDADEHVFLAHLRDACSDLRTMQHLAQRFCALIRERDAAAREPWLRAVEASDCPELRSFAAGRRRDRAAVDAALTLAWSQGPTEGKVNKLKDVSSDGRIGGHVESTVSARPKARILPPAYKTSVSGARFVI